MRLSRKSLVSHDQRNNPPTSPISNEKPTELITPPRFRVGNPSLFPTKEMDRRRGRGGISVWNTVHRPYLIISVCIGMYGGNKSGITEPSHRSSANRTRSCNYDVTVAPHHRFFRFFLPNPTAFCFFWWIVCNTILWSESYANDSFLPPFSPPNVVHVIAILYWICEGVPASKLYFSNLFFFFFEKNSDRFNMWFFYLPARSFFIHYISSARTFWGANISSDWRRPTRRPSLFSLYIISLFFYQLLFFPVSLVPFTFFFPLLINARSCPIQHRTRVSVEWKN